MSIGPVEAATFRLRHIKHKGTGPVGDESADGGRSTIVYSGALVFTVQPVSLCLSSSHIHTASQPLFLSLSLSPTLSLSLLYQPPKRRLSM